MKYNVKNYSLVLVLLLFTLPILAQNAFKEYNGKIVSANSNKGLEAVNISIVETNISTITNADGGFLIKIPEQHQNSKIIISGLGFKSKTVMVSELKPDNNKFKLEAVITELSEVNISAYKDAGKLVRDVFKSKRGANQKESILMTAFYRETIKRRNRNVSLTEAIVDIVKQPNTNKRKDVVTLGKARKRTDYKRLDTVSVKLQGGPYSTLFLDVMKYPEYIFTEESIKTYTFSFDPSTTINNKKVYVVDFRPKNNIFNLNYMGKLYIDAKQLALVSAKYALDLSDAKASKNAFVKRKPRNIEVFPLLAEYHVDYKPKNGKWYYSYSTLALKFKIKKKRHIFNKVYSLSSEMVVTNWEVYNGDKISNKERLRPTVIITDAISGFSDPDFWGDNNLIEPDKSIESAIRKINRNFKN